MLKLRFFVGPRTGRLIQSLNNNLLPLGERNMKTQHPGLFNKQQNEKSNLIKNTCKRSHCMDLLYGQEKAEHVWQRLEAIDPKLNEEIQKIAYDHYWALPGISLKERSLVTVVSLISLGKEEQTRIHLHGLINLGTTPSQLAFLINYIGTRIPLDSSQKAIAACIDVISERNYQRDEIEQFKILILTKSFNLIERDKSIIDVALTSASGNNDDTKITIDDVLQKGLSVNDLKCIFIHQIVYCGFPTAMNSFSVLSESLTVRELPKARL